MWEGWFWFVSGYRIRNPLVPRTRIRGAVSLEKGKKLEQVMDENGEETAADYKAIKRVCDCVRRRKSVVHRVVDVVTCVARMVTSLANF